MPKVTIHTDTPFPIASGDDIFGRHYKAGEIVDGYVADVVLRHALGAPVQDVLEDTELPKTNARKAATENK